MISRYRALYYVLCTIFLLLNTFCTQSQSTDCSFTLSGITKEEHKPEPLSYAVIQVLELDTIISSDDEGHYIFQDLCEGKYTLVCSFLGFKTDTQSIYLNKDMGVFFNLHPNNCELDEVVVKGTSIALEVKLNEPINSVAIEGIGMVEEMSGASTLKTGNNTTKPINHGLHSNRLRIIQAGASIENQQWGEEHGVELSGVRSFTLSDQNMLMYNHDGIGGTLIAEPSISVNEDSLQNIQGSVFSSVNSNGRAGKVGGEIEGKLEPIPWLGIKLFGSSSRGGDIHTPDYNLKNTGFMNYDYGVMLDAKHKKFTSLMFYSLVNQELGIYSGSHIGSVTDFQNAINASQPDDIHTGEFDYLISGPKQHVEHELFSYKLKYNEKYEVQISRQFNRREEYEGHGGEEPKIDLQLNLTTLNGDIRCYTSFLKEWNSIIGVNMMDQVNTWDYRNFIPNFQNRRMGGYMLMRNDSIDEGKVILKLGARYDYYNNDFYLLSGLVNREYGNPSYDFGVSRDLGNNFIISFTNGMSWRPPSANELFSDGIHHGAATFEVGDVDLGKEISYQNQLNILKNSSKVSSSVSMYANYIQNYIYSQPTGEVLLTVRGAFPMYQYVQTDALFYGSDFQLNYNLPDIINTESKFSIVKTYDFEVQNSLIGIMPNRVEQNISIHTQEFNKYEKGNFVRHNCQLTLEGAYYFERKNTNNELEFLSPPPGYFLFNSIFIYQVKNKKDYRPVNIRFAINNILNTRYRNYMNRYRFFADEMGRNFKLSLEIPF